MSDKEPRRRKKRKDSQSQKKDDTRTDDQTFMPLRSDSKDSDQELEEEVVVPAYQPSVFAKGVFVLLFSCLVLSMSFIFISLQGADRGAVDLFDDHHSEEHDILHDDHDEIETWTSTETSFQENVEDLLPDIGNILSLNNEHLKDSENDEDVQESDEHESLDESELASQFSEINPDLDDDISSVEDSIEEHVEMTDEVVEELISPETYTETTAESSTSEPEPTSETVTVYPDPEVHTVESEYIPPKEEPESVPEELEIDSVPESSTDDSDFTYTTQTVAETETASSSVSNDEDTLPLESKTDEDSYSKSSESDNADDNEKLSIKTPKDELYSYEKAPITNEADYKIRNELDELDNSLEKSPERALQKCEKLLTLHKESPRLHYMKAQALDKLAETLRSNKNLEEAIASYEKVLSLKDVPKELYLLSGKRVADRMRFRGLMGKSVKLLSQMLEKFPGNVELKNLIAVGYLMIGQNGKAKQELYEVLKMDPDSGFAKVHLGFILKTDDSNYKEAVKFLSEGIASREPGVIDGRFYFHLGDALHRIGKQDEAMQVYNEAVKEGLFLSAYQRSLYNVNGLTGKPWWNPHSTTYGPYFKILEKNWLSIRDEALSLTNEKSSGFLPETEGLQEKGDWKQFELFARGRKLEKNCLKAPKTCSLISQMPDAASCKRGQVKFSIMTPSTHVWAHTGPTNCRLRSHLGLVVPEGAKIRVANETRSWEEGKVILFDDSFEHEVWHNGNASRLVLIVDFWHPELTPYQKKTLTPI